MNREPLEKLLEYCERSDDCQYGTLDTTLVRDLVNEALAVQPNVARSVKYRCPECGASTWSDESGIDGNEFWHRTECKGLPLPVATSPTKAARREALRELQQESERLGLYDTPTVQQSACNTVTDSPHK